MKNAEIILQKQVELMKRGFLKGTHNYFHYHPTPDTEEYIQIPEPIYTKSEAQKEGYELLPDTIPYSELLFPIWRPTANGIILKNTQFYKLSQLHRII